MIHSRAIGTFGTVSRRNLVVGIALCFAAVAMVGQADAAGSTARDQKVFEQNLKSRNDVVGVIEFYSSSGGESGYYKLFNTTSQNRKYRIRIILEDGRDENRIVHAAAGRYSGAATFTAAGTRRSGIRRVELIYAEAE